MDDQIHELLRRGKAAANAHDNLRARQLLSAVVQRDPHNEEAWLWLSGVVDDTARMRYCLQRVLALNPNNPYAAAALRELKPAPVPAAPAPMAPPQPEHQRPVLRRRPASMIEGEVVHATLLDQARVMWGYVGVWSGIIGLHVVLLVKGGQTVPFGAALGRVIIGALAAMIPMLLAWWATLSITTRRQTWHTLSRSALSTIVVAAVWPSALVALAALAFGVVASTGGALGSLTSLLRWAGLLASLMLLVRGLRTQLLDQPRLDMRTARALSLELLLTLAGFGGLALMIGLQLARRVVGG